MAFVHILCWFIFLFFRLQLRNLDWIQEGEKWISAMRRVVLFKVLYILAHLVTKIKFFLNKDPIFVIYPLKHKIYLSGENLYFWIKVAQIRNIEKLRVYSPKSCIFKAFFSFFNVIFLLFFFPLFHFSPNSYFFPRWPFYPLLP